MSLHGRIIETLQEHEALVAAHCELYSVRVVTEESLGPYGDIDVRVEGIDYTSQQPGTAIIEVKSHRGLVPHYRSYQLPKYQRAFPAAKQFVVFSIDGAAWHDLVFERHA